jgi:thioredoxin 1
MKKILLSLTLLACPFLWSATELNESNAQKFIESSKGILVVDFYAHWCPPCKQMKPIFDSLADEYKGKYSFAKVDIATYPAVGRIYNIQAMPTFVIFRDGKKVDTSQGGRSKEDLMSWIETNSK